MLRANARRLSSFRKETFQAFLGKAFQKTRKCFISSEAKLRILKLFVKILNFKIVVGKDCFARILRILNLFSYESFKS